MVGNSNYNHICWGLDIFCLGINALKVLKGRAENWSVVHKIEILLLIKKHNIIRCEKQKNSGIKHWFALFQFPGISQTYWSMFMKSHGCGQLHLLCSDHQHPHYSKRGSKPPQSRLPLTRAHWLPRMDRGKAERDKEGTHLITRKWNHCPQGNWAISATLGLTGLSTCVILMKISLI